MSATFSYTGLYLLMSPRRFSPFTFELSRSVFVNRVAVPRIITISEVTENIGGKIFKKKILRKKQVNVNKHVLHASNATQYSLSSSLLTMDKMVGERAGKDR